MNIGKVVVVLKGMAVVFLQYETYEKYFYPPSLSAVFEKKVSHEKYFVKLITMH